MKALILLAAIVMPVGGGCKGWQVSCHYEIINPYQDSCEDYQSSNCGVTYYNCDSDNEYPCSHGFVVKEVCEKIGGKDE